MSGASSPSPACGRGAGERATPALPEARIRNRALRHAKLLRGKLTDAEHKLWFQLRARRFLDLKFKRQKPVGPYIVDFVCLEHGLVIELDGGQHVERQTRDEQRSAYLAERGFRVLRFWNDDVLKQTDSVLEAIRLAIAGTDPSPPTPLPQAGEGNRS